ncbi:MAG: FliO/MopB family protein, partial [Spirochaetota bacterium]
MGLVCVLSVSPLIVSAYAQESETQNQSPDAPAGESAPAAGSEVDSGNDGENATGDLYAYTEPEVEDVSYTWIIVKTMVVIVLMVLGFFLFFRYVSGRPAGPVAGRNVLQVKAMLPLGQNKALQVVEVGSRLLVLGVTDSQISLVREITERDEIDRIKLQSSMPNTQENRDFQGFLKENISTFMSFVAGGMQGASHHPTPEGNKT